MYKQTGKGVLSLKILENKYKLFRYVLRSHSGTPAQKTMDHYFEKSSSEKSRGRPIMTWPNLLHNYIIMLKKHKELKIKYSINQLKSVDHFGGFRLLGQER